MDEDELLMEAINEQADRAEKAKPSALDREALANALHDSFPHRTSEDITQKLDDVWRSRGIFFATVHR
jgi:hypothetical protein